MKIETNVIICGLALAGLCGLGVVGLLYSTDAPAAPPATRIVYRAVRYEGVSYKDITALQLKGRIDDDRDNAYIILDVRDEASYDAGHIPGAANVPLKELGYRMFALDKTKDIVAYCKTGAQSRIACQILVNGGFKDVYNLVGGIKAWNYPTETSDGRIGI